MADKSSAATKAVERLYRKRPQATLDEYLVVATRADKSLVGIPKRSFNAIYLLPMKRVAAAGKPRAQRKPAGKKTAPKTKGRRTAKKVRRRRRIVVSAAGRAAARNLVLVRDQRVVSTLGSSGDPRQAYALAAEIDDYIDQLASALRK